MADLLASQPIALQDMLGCARRELGMRRKVYPGWVFRKKMTQDESDREIRFMAAIVAYLQAELEAELLRR